jgi:hypothetical protein
MESEHTYGEVPRATKLQLFEEVGRMIVPFVAANQSTHPISVYLRELRATQPAVMQLGSDIGATLNINYGGRVENTTRPKMVFDNSFIAAYGLIKVGYVRVGKQIPRVPEPPVWHQWLTDEPQEQDPTIAQISAKLNARQQALNAEYPDLLEAVQTVASEITPRFKQGAFDVGAAAIGAGAMYHAFKKTEQLAALPGADPLQPVWPRS